MRTWKLDIGRYEEIDPKTGEARRMVLPVPGFKGAHWLVCGSTGSGKTWMIKLAIAKLTAEYGSDIAFVVCDPDEVNYKAFTPRASTIGFGDESAIELLELVEDEIRRRRRLMWDLDIEEWTPEQAERIGPFLILVVEEFSALSLLPKPATVRGEKAPKSPVDRVAQLAMRMRKSGGGLILATQFPNVKTIPNPILAQCAVRWCGRTQEPEQTEAVLGTRRYPCHDPDHPKGVPMDAHGVAYVNDGMRVRRGRTDGITPEMFGATARKFAADRHDFGWPHQILPNDLALAATGGK